MPDTGKGTHVSSQQDAAVIMAYLRSKSSGNRIKASVGSKTRSSDPLFFREFRNIRVYGFPLFFLVKFHYKKRGILCNERGGQA